MLKHFSDKRTEALHRCNAYISEGIEMGKRPNLTSGGLVRSSGGWSVITSVRRANIHLKSDKRILGDTDFVDVVLKATDESLQRRYALKAKGWDLDRLAQKSARIYGLEPDQLCTVHPADSKNTKHRPKNSARIL